MPTINEYINTGILEAYCMGIATEAEQLEVEKLCLTNEYIKAEVMAIQQTLEEYATKFHQMPSANLKNTILSSIEGIESNHTLKTRRRNS